MLCYEHVALHFFPRLRPGNRISSLPIRKTRTSRKTRHRRPRKNSALEGPFPSSRASSTKSHRKHCPENGRKNTARFRKVKLKAVRLSNITSFNLPDLLSLNLSQSTFFPPSYVLLPFSSFQANSYTTLPFTITWTIFMGSQSPCPRRPSRFPGNRPEALLLSIKPILSASPKTWPAWLSTTGRGLSVEYDLFRKKLSVTILTQDSALVIDVFGELMFTNYLVHFVLIFSQHVGSRNGDADNLRSASASSNLDDSRPTADDNSGFLNAGV